MIDGSILLDMINQRTLKIEDASEKAMCAIDSAEFDWSDMAEEEIQANMALMAFSDSELYGSKEYQMGLLRAELEKGLKCKPTIGCNKESDNSKENTDDSLEQHQITDTETSSVKSSLKRDNDAPIIEDWVSDDEDDDEPNPKVEKKTVIPTATKKEFVKPEKPVKRSVSCPNQQRKRIVSGNNYNKKDNDYYSKTSHSSAHKHMAPRAVLMKTGLKSVNTARPVNTVRSVNTGRPFSTARPFRSTVNTVRARGFNVSNSQLNDKGFVDSGCSRHMTGNIAHLSDFKDFDGGYVTFGGGSRINGKKAKAVSTACYVQNRVLIVKPHNKTPYELFRGFKPAIGFMKPFGCHVTILNNLDNLGKFNGKSNEENKPMSRGMVQKALVDLDSLTQSMNYVPVVAGTFSNDFAGIQGVSESSTSSQQDQDNQDCIVMPIWKDASYFGDAAPRTDADDGLQDENDATEKSHDDSSLKDNGTADQQVNTARPEINTGSREVSTAVPEVNTATPEDLVGPSPASEDTQVEDQEIELGNIPQSYAVPTTPHTRIHKDHPIEHVIGDVQSSVQTRRMTTSYSELGFLSAIYEGKSHQDLHTCLFACFLSQEEPKRVSKALSDPTWVEAMQEELLQFKLQKVWILVDLPKGHRAIGTKWVYRNKKDERGIVIRNKARLVAQGHTFIEDARLYDSFEDPDHPDKVYKVVKALYGLHQAPRAWSTEKERHFYQSDNYVHEILIKYYNYTDVMSALTPTNGKPLVQEEMLSVVDLVFKDSPLDIVVTTDSDYAGATQDRKSTTGGCQFLGNRLISWQCKKQTVVATSTTEAEYVAAASCCGRSAEATNDDNGEVQITATIDGHSKTITEASLRRHLKLDDHDGITSIPNSEIFEQLALMGYHTDSDKLTFQKGAFSPQWRFLIHSILHCLSPKKTAWEQFSSNIATAVICLATNRKYNFSRMIFEHMVSNISSPHKFFMYPRFIQICLDMQRKQLQQHSRTYPVPSLSIKLFNNMKRHTKGYSGQEVALFPTMIDVSEPSTSPSRITSSPSHSPEPLPEPSPEPSTTHSPDHTTVAPTQPSPTQPSTGVEHHFSTPHDSPLHVVHSHGSDEGSLKLNDLTNLVTQLSERIGVLEYDLRKTKKRVKVVLSEDDADVEDDSSKQGRKLSDAEVQEKASTETEPFIQEVTPTEVIQDQENSEKGSGEVSTAGATKGTASEVPVVSTAEENVSTAEENVSTAGRTVTYSRRSEEQRKRKDKGKAIMIEFEPKKKSKK
ncbi:ribonuclease H-like domain-containing protein, partial [Tanacetum coccineum]